MLVDLPGTRIHIGVVVALVVVVLVHLLLTRTSFGTRLDVLGANPRAAVHMGIDVPAHDRGRVPHQRRPHRAGRGRRHAGHLRLHARRLGPGLRA